MNIPVLKSALAVIIGKVYAATHIDCLSPEDVDRLREAVNTITREWSDSDVFRGRATFVAESVADSGILSRPYRTPAYAHQIVEDAERLSQYLDQISK